MNISTQSQKAFHRGTAPIFDILSRDQVQHLSDLYVDDSLTDRIDELASKANEGELSAEERDEYEAYLEANNLIAILQAEAQFRLKLHG